MKAVYQSTQAYLQIDYGEVNRRILEYSEDKKHIVGIKVSEQLSNQRTEFYIFGEGKNHNRLTLTDPTEIRNMREYIKWRHDSLITEVSFSGNEEELYPPVVSEADTKKKAGKLAEDSGEMLEWDDLSESDRRIYNNMTSR